MKSIDQFYKNKNIVNGLELNTPIYKFFPLKYISSLLQGKLYVGKVSSWEDVYENFLFKQRFSLEDGTLVSADSLIRCSFGQSWTKSDETDAMWRIYSRIPEKRIYSGDFHELDNVAVRIKATAQKLYDAVYTDDSCMISTYIGSVEYNSLDSINQWLSNLKLSFGDLSQTMARSLFLKRQEFSHEEEVRIIISYATDDQRINNDNIIFQIDPYSFIEEILLDPRLIGTEIERVIREQLVVMGTQVNKINTSQMYNFTPCAQPILIKN